MPVPASTPLTVKMPRVACPSDPKCPRHGAIARHAKIREAASDSLGCPQSRRGIIGANRDLMAERVLKGDHVGHRVVLPYRHDSGGIGRGGERLRES